MTTSPDVIVVGGGPAGSGTAFQLARRGVRVLVLDRARFPRSKPCAECLSPQASRILNDMGALDTFSARGAWLKGMSVRSPNGTTMRGDYVAAHGFRALRGGGLSIRREVLDAGLLDCARRAGAEVHEGVRVTDIVRGANGTVEGVRAQNGDGVSREIRAAMIVAADGLYSLVAKRLSLTRTSVWPKRISLVGHYRGVADVSAYGEMHVERDGFVGIADVGEGVTTVAAVFSLARAREISGDRAGFLERWLGTKPHLAPRFAAAERVGETRAVGPFASHAHRAWHPGAVLVGDAADFFDPFTGEGIYAALRGAELAADAIIEALAGAEQHRALQRYEDARRAEFGGKWLVERAIGTAVASPFLMNRALSALAARKDLADLLVGVTGDFVPAEHVLRLAFLTQLFLVPRALLARRIPAWR